MAAPVYKTDVVRGGEQPADQTELSLTSVEVCPDMLSVAENGDKSNHTAEHSSSAASSVTGSQSHTEDACVRRESNATNSDAEAKLRLEWSRTYPIGAGLVNMGNTCFLNSTLQCLVYTPPLANYLLSRQHSEQCRTDDFCMLCLLEAHTICCLSRSGVVKPLEILQSLKSICRQMSWGSQEDAHEFLRHVIDAMLKTTANVNQTKIDNKSSKQTTLVSQIFGGVLRSQVVCTVCKNPSDTYDPFMDLSLDIKNAMSVDEALDKFFKSERLYGENAYDCSKCRRCTSAEKCFAIKTAPAVLTLQLKRFDLGSKLRKHVNFSSSLDIRRYTTVKQGEPMLYELYAVLVHHGMSTNSGHYFAYVLSPGRQWYCMNDHMVMETSWQRVQAAEAYVLFYCRRHRQPQNRADLTTSRPVYGPAARPEHSNSQRPSPLATKVTNGHGSSLGVLCPLNNGSVLTTKSGMHTPSASLSRPKVTLASTNGFHSQQQQGPRHYTAPSSIAFHRERTIKFGIKPHTAPSVSHNGAHTLTLNDSSNPPLKMKIKNGRVLSNTANEPPSAAAAASPLPKRFISLVPYVVDDGESSDVSDVKSGCSTPAALICRDHSDEAAKPSVTTLSNIVNTSHVAALTEPVLVNSGNDTKPTDNILPSDDTSIAKTSTVNKLGHNGLLEDNSTLIVGNTEQSDQANESGPTASDKSSTILNSATRPDELLISASACNAVQQLAKQQSEQMDIDISNKSRSSYSMPDAEQNNESDKSANMSTLSTHAESSAAGFIPHAKVTVASSFISEQSADLSANKTFHLSENAAISVPKSTTACPLVISKRQHVHQQRHYRQRSRSSSSDSSSTRQRKSRSKSPAAVKRRRSRSRSHDSGKRRYRHSSSSSESRDRYKRSRHDVDHSYSNIHRENSQEGFRVNGHSSSAHGRDRDRDHSKYSRSKSSASPRKSKSHSTNHRVSNSFHGNEHVDYNGDSYGVRRHHSSHYSDLHHRSSSYHDRRSEDKRRSHDNHRHGRRQGDHHCSRDY